MELSPKNESRKPDLGRLAWEFQLDLKHAETMSKWLQK